FFHLSVHHRSLHSFPTRRSSDLIPSISSRICRPEVTTSRVGWPLVQTKSCISRWATREAGGRTIIVFRTGLRNCPPRRMSKPRRSEEHTSELQSRFDLVCRLLLE